MRNVQSRSSPERRRWTFEGFMLSKHAASNGTSLAAVVSTGRNGEKAGIRPRPGANLPTRRVELL